MFGSQSGHIYIWDSLTLREHRKAKGHDGESRGCGLGETRGRGFVFGEFKGCGMRASPRVCGLRHSTHTLPPTGAVMCVDISQDGGTLVTGGKDRCLCVWKLS